MANLDPDQLDSQPGASHPEEQNLEISPVVPAIPLRRPRKVYSGMWGNAEIGVVAASVIALFLTGVVYFVWVVPSNNELANNIFEAKRLEAELELANSRYGEISSTETQVAKIVSSVDEFESRFLPVISTGQSALYQRINGLIAAYGLVNTSGPDYATLETADGNSGELESEEKGRSKFRSIYPGVYVSTTVEGSYQNIRRFIREIETGREFILVSSVELAPSDSSSRRDKNPNQNGATESAKADQFNPSFGNPAARGLTPGINPQLSQNPSQTLPVQKGKTHGETVSLHIELAAYFRRPGFSVATDVK